MYARVTQYFDETILPMIHNRFPDLSSQMSIMVLGSVGLGIDDEHSDMEAAIYLDDPIWQQEGAELQLSLNQLLEATNLWQPKGSIICVHPFSWLLDGQANPILKGGSEGVPWESISIPTLFTMQENRIYHDPQGTLARLREATAPAKYPTPLWRKLVATKFRQLLYEDYSELRRSALRDLWEEYHMVLGPVIGGLLEIGLLLDHTYYPWRTHLRWAFDRSSLAVRFGSDLDQVVECDWMERVAVIGTLIDKYKDYMDEHSLLPEINLKSNDLNNELLWAERLNAWTDPNWRELITAWTQKARQAGYSSPDFWVWSLWGM